MKFDRASTAPGGGKKPEGLAEVGEGGSRNNGLAAASVGRSAPVEIARIMMASLSRSKEEHASNEFKLQFLDLAKFGQVDLFDRELIKAIAGPMFEAVNALLGPLGMLVVLTEAKRRQIYYAAMAGLFSGSNGQVKVIQAEQERKLLEEMLFLPNADLIKHVYGFCPVGFVKLVARFGQKAQKPNHYVKLIEYLNRHPGQGAALLRFTQRDAVTEEFLELLLLLPPTEESIKLALKLKTAEAYRTLVKPYQVLTGLSELKGSDVTKLIEGTPPVRLLEDRYLDLAFPKPILTDPRIRQIASGRELIEMGRRYRNCLKSRIADGIKGRSQFYVFNDGVDEPVIFSIANEGPFGWYLEEYRLPRNRKVPLFKYRQLMALMKTHRVRLHGPVEKLMEPYWGPTYDGPMDLPDEFFPL